MKTKLTLEEYGMMCTLEYFEDVGKQFNIADLVYIYDVDHERIASLVESLVDKGAIKTETARLM